MGFIRKAGAPRKGNPKRLFVHPAELAEKLIKEMEDHKVSDRGRVWAPARYTVYLCLDDYERLRGKAARVQSDLVDQLYEHVEDMGYELEEDISVGIVLDEELELGRFGILAHPLRRLENGIDVAAPAVGGARQKVTPSPESRMGGPGASASPGLSPAATAPAAAAPAAAAPAAPAPAVPGPSSRAARTIALRSGDVVREFSGERVIIGRGRDVDFRIEDPGVSRRHAAVFFEGDRLVLEDLGSTNGTLVNGYPITRTILGPKDVVVIGQRRITVEAR